MASWSSRWKASYESDKRVMFKLKHERDCDCVVAGFRWYKESQNNAIGSLLLGLYDDAGRCSMLASAPALRRKNGESSLAFLRPYRKNALGASSVEILG